MLLFALIGTTWGKNANKKRHSRVNQRARRRRLRYRVDEANIEQAAGLGKYPELDNN